MSSAKKYFHDHLVLLLLSVNVFLVIVAIAIITGRILTGTGGYYSQYFSVGLNNFKTGSIVDALSFIVFALLVLLIHTVLSVRTYYIHRPLAIAILSLGILLLILTVIISNALLIQR